MLIIKNFSILIHPGLNDSGPDHWHTHWEQAFSDFVRVQKADRGHPVYDAWAATRPSPGRRAR
jgi:predicted alpha/beta hydrolase family esterase